MDNKICSPNVNMPQILPAWPFLDTRGAAIFVSQAQPTQDWEPRGLPPREGTKASRRMADFSIRSILAPEGPGRERGDPEEPAGGAAVERGRRIPPYPWISSSRFKPPFVPRANKPGAGRSRQASRSPRVPFSATQLGTLEQSFRQTRYLSSGQVKEVALFLGLTENRVKIWFQNRRARERRDFLKQQPNRSPGVARDPNLP